MKKLLLSIIALFSVATLGFSQEEDVIKRKVSVSLIYPISSNGSAINVENNVSVNLLFGANAGLRGGEISTIGAYNKNDVKGAQYAGLFNITKGDVVGAQFSGLTNATNGNSSGAQFSAVANVTRKNATGVQFSGVSNTTLGNSKGVSFAVVNNFTRGEVQGAQVSVTNIGLSKVDGAQLGLVNYADTLAGTQFGLINISRSVERGTPIGFLNIVKDGYYAIELTSGEINAFGINYKMGTTNFYTIFKYGYTPHTVSSKTNHNFGLGFGTMQDLSRNGRHRLAIDLSASHYLPYENKAKNYVNNNLNIITKLDLTYQFSITKHLSVIGGPSLNWYYSEVKLNDKGNNGTIGIPSETLIYQQDTRNYSNSVWIGFNLGVSYTF